MTETEFIERVRNAEREVSTHAGRYRLKLALFALLGYGVIFLVLTGLVALLGGMVAAVLFSSSLALLLLKKKLLLPVLVMIWVMARSLWVRFDRPQGFELGREEYPALFAAIDDLRGELHALPIHQVILTPELNAAVTQTPRLGVFGWQFNTLFLGLELLMLLTPDEARAVLAHEFGHLSQNHSRFAGWIYRIRYSWYRIMEGLRDNGSVGARLLQRFFDWYAPSFSAYSFALARSNEYEADTISAQLTSPETATSALVNFRVAGPYVNEYYWEWFFGKADSMPAPDHMPYAGLVTFLTGNPQTQDDIRRSLQQQLQYRTSYEDTHPSLADRLANLGNAPIMPQPAGAHNAAAAWLGGRYRDVVSHFDAQWYDSMRERWEARHDYVQQARQGMAELGARPLDTLDMQEHWNLAAWTEEFDSAQQALPLYQSYHQRFPGDTDADFVIGRILHGQGSDECLQYLESAAANPRHTVRACELAYHHLRSRGASVAAEYWRRRAVERIELEREIAAERNAVAASDTFLAPELPEALERDLRRQLAASRHAGKAWIARKQVRHHPEDPVYVIAFVEKGFHWTHDKAMAGVAADLTHDGDLFVVPRAGDYRQLARQVIKAGKRLL